MFETINPFVMPLSSKIVQHVYQKSAHGEIIFYSSRDAIVFFTIFCVCARKYGIRPTMLCIMVDHTHQIIPTNERSDLSAFIHENTRLFSAEFNKDAERKGSLFKRKFGSAAKYGSKHIRSINAYVANNPVEKRICQRAEEYQWNFLAYCTSSHPFSEKLVIRRTSNEMKKAIRIVKDLRSRNMPINYTSYDRITSKLSIKERKQIVDYIISEYNVLDYTSLLSEYSSYDGMLEAFANTKGAEYDIKEEYDKYSNRNYSLIVDYLAHIGVGKPKDVLKMKESAKRLLASRIMAERIAPEYQVKKFLHLELG